jgi:hypothetical protein
MSKNKLSIIKEVLDNELNINPYLVNCSFKYMKKLLKCQLKEKMKYVCVVHNK